MRLRQNIDELLNMKFNVFWESFIYFQFFDLFFSRKKKKKSACSRIQVFFLILISSSFLMVFIFPLFVFRKMRLRQSIDALLEVSRDFAFFIIFTSCWTFLVKTRLRQSIDDFFNIDFYVFLIVFSFPLNFLVKCACGRVIIGALLNMIFHVFQRYFS